MHSRNEQKWYVILNPHAGARKGSRDKQKIINLLRVKGFFFEYTESTHQGHITELVREAVSNGFNSLIIAGGDGSLNEAFNGVMQQTIISPSNVTLAIIPVGTGNDWIKTFDIPNDYEKSLEIIMKKMWIRQDGGVVSFGKNGSIRKRYFLNMAGFGFDAMVAAQVNKLKEKGWTGTLLYLMSLLSTFGSFKGCVVQIHVDGQTYRESIFSVSIGIGKYNGGGMKQVPYAVPDNGEFAITIIRKLGFMHILKNMTRLYNGNFIKDRHVFTTHGKKIEIISPCKLPGEVDGEQLGYSHFKVEIVPACIKVICGSDKYLKHKLTED